MVIYSGDNIDYVIVGLGNPGKVYENSRHNIGFKALDYVNSQCDAGRGCKRMLHSSLTDKCVLDGHSVYMAKPQTYMNNSGMAVVEIMRYYKVRPNKLIVIHDDIALPVGHFKIKKGGGAGGHNGLKSIIQHIGTDDFIRIRIGVGEKPEGWDLANYVLGKIPENEYKAISDRFSAIFNALSYMMNYDINRAMTAFNSVCGQLNIQKISGQK